MDKAKTIEVLLWAEIEPDKKGFVIKIEEGKYSIMAKRKNNDIDTYPGHGKVIKVSLEIINRLEAYFSSHGTAPMPNEIFAIVKDVS